MPDPGAADAARRLVVERNLVRAAFDHLTRDAVTSLPFEVLGPTKALLKRFLSTEPWGSDHDDALAAAVGPGEGEWRRPLDADVALEFGWQSGRFRVHVCSTAADSGSDAGGGSAPEPARATGLTFAGPVVPEVTPNPRTIMFRVGPINDGASRWYESANDIGDPSVAKLFDRFEEVANVLVGPDFVAVGLHRPGDWERLLEPVLAVVSEEFAEHAAIGDDGDDDDEPLASGPVPVNAPTAGRGRNQGRLVKAWQELGSLRPADPTDLVLVRAAAGDRNSAFRQVAANLLREADPEVAAAEWACLVTDAVRSVRRATVDAMVDVGRQELRPLLEAALADADAWVRWKALRGLAEIGSAPSRETIAAHAADPDFRVRLEAAAALQSG
ncbi:MAG: HEAT repeat domain-containing protein [Acidimicrobiales bacterium]